jgi:lysozyme
MEADFVNKGKKKDYVGWIKVSRQINEKGLQIIKDSESFMPNVYTCAGGKRTIGWGHVLPDDTPDSFSASRSICEQWLEKDVEIAEQGVEEACEGIPLTDNQFSALVSLVFNIGIGNFSGSTLFKKLKEGDYQGAADEFPKWRKAKGKVLTGLIRRRAAERSLFLETE